MDNNQEYSMKDRSAEEQEKIVEKVKIWFKDTYQPPFNFDAIINDDLTISIIETDKKGRPKR